ncbi:MAG TPA: hypothetical protein VFP80_07085 [Thermoanaerobaculia bacterium]|nr:hypothetical protein [Thermoanaerobaculia bacterium]
MHSRTIATMLVAAAWIWAAEAGAQSRPPAGRLTFFGSAQTLNLNDGTTRDFSELTAAMTFRSRLSEEDSGLEYALDVRGTQYPSSRARNQRTRLYDAWVGGRTSNGRLTIRGGQMWLHDLGALGSVGGVMTEYRTGPLPAGRLRFGLFAGAEPKSFDTGYVRDVRKGGAWVALENGALRRHVLGYVATRNSGLTERSVLTASNYVPFGTKLFVYQLAEYDLQGPAGIGGGGLNYFFVNARYTPSRTLEVLATVHRGRSIDARTITEDILNGRPVDQKLLEGFLYESTGGRVTAEIVRNVRVHAGYATDRHNREDRRFGRISAGIWASNVGGSGFDATLSDNRSKRPDGSYDSWYASLGRSLGTKVYVTVDYATSLVVVRVIDNGVTIERHPRSRRYGVNGVWSMTHAFSFIATLERLQDDSSTDERGTFGVVYRF